MKNDFNVDIQKFFNRKKIDAHIEHMQNIKNH